MKNKKILIIFFSLLLCFSFGFNAFAAPSITITPGTEEFIFNPTNKDMFEDFKDMMPGDSRTQQIALVNNETDINATIYMRAEVEQKDKDFLRWYKLSVYYSEEANIIGTLLAENVASIEGSLQNDIKLGTIKPGQTAYITVKIESDKQMSNDYKLQSGMIHWIFSCEEEKITETTTEKPTERPTEKPTERPKTEQPSRTQRPSTTRRDPYRPTTKVTEAPTTQPEPSTKPSKIPYTGSRQYMSIAVSLAALSGVTIIVMSKAKKKEENNTDET